MQARIQNTQERVNQCFAENKETNKYEQKVLLLKNKLDTHKDSENFDKVRYNLYQDLKTQIETVLLDINADKIKSQNEAAQLREQLARKNQEIVLITKELIKLRKENESLKKMVSDMNKNPQPQAVAKPNENSPYIINKLIERNLFKYNPRW